MILLLLQVLLLFYLNYLFGFLTLLILPGINSYLTQTNQHIMSIFLLSSSLIFKFLVSISNIIITLSFVLSRKKLTISS